VFVLPALTPVTAAVPAEKTGLAPPAAEGATLTAQAQSFPPVLN